MAAYTRVDPAQSAIISQLLATDTNLRDQARALISQALSDIHNIQTRGDPAMRAKLALALAAPITKAIFETGEDDGNADLRSEVQAMFSEMRGELMDEVAGGAADDKPASARVIVAKS